MKKRLCLCVVTLFASCAGGLCLEQGILEHAKSIREDVDVVEAAWCRLAAKLNADTPPRRLALTLKKALGGTDVLVDIFDSRRTGRSVLMCAPIVSSNVHKSRLSKLEGAGELDIRIHVMLSFEGDPFARKMYSGGHFHLPVTVHLRLETAGGRVTGSYSWKPEPIPAEDPDERPRKSPLKPMSGAVSGTIGPAVGGPGRDASFWKIRRDMAPSVLYPMTVQIEKWADGLYSRIRAGELMRVHGCGFEEAFSNVLRPMVVRPRLALAKQAKKEAKKSVSLDDIDMDDEFGLGDDDLPAAGGAVAKPSDPEVKKAVEHASQIARRLKRMRRLVERYEKTQSTPALKTGFMDIQDTEFGPWYGTDGLAVVDDKVNVLPAEIGGEGAQEWRSVSVWQALGPFPLFDRRMSTPLLPDAVWTGEEVCAVQKGRIKHAKPGETEWRTRRARGNVIFGCVTPPARFDLNPVATGLPRVMGGGRGGCPHATHYMTTVIRSAEPVVLWAGIGINRTAQLWLDDTLVWNSPRDVVPANSQESRGLIRLSLRKGDNRLMLRLDADFSSPYAWLRLCLRGEPRSPEDTRKAASRVAAVRAGIAPEKAIGWRGDGTGVYPGTRPPVAWNRKKKQNVLWHTPTEYFGNATPVPAPGRNKVFVTQEPCWLICLDKDSGKELWRRAVTLLDLLPEDARKKGWALHEAWWKARRERDKIREGEGDGLKFAVDKWLRYSSYWAEGTGVWARGTKSVKDEREGASPELVALFDERDALEAEPDQEAVQEKLTSVLKKIEKIREKEAGDDPNSPVAIHARLAKAERAYVMHVKQYSRVSGMGGGYWEDYCGWMYATPVTDGEHVWVKTGSDVAACFDMDGNEKWKVQMWGSGGADKTLTSPRLSDGKLILQLIDQDCNLKSRPKRNRMKLVALNAATGEILWETRGLPQPSWNSSTPGIMTLAGENTTMKVVVTANAVVVRLDDGKVLFRDAGPKSGVDSPVVCGDRVICTDNLTPLQLVMCSRDRLGARPSWSLRASPSYGGAFVVDDIVTWIGGLAAARDSKGAVREGFCVDVGIGEKWAAVAGYDMRTGHAVYKVPALRKAGNTWTPACASERHVYHITGDTKFNSCGAKAPMDMVVMSRGRDPLFLANNAIDRTYGPGAIDGDRIYIRGYGGTTCVAYTGEEGRRYEARIVARNLLDGMFPGRPRSVEAKTVPMRERSGIKLYSKYKHPRNVGGTTQGCLVKHGLPAYRYWIIGPVPRKAAPAAMAAFGGPAVPIKGDEMHEIGGQSYQWFALTQGCLKAKGFKAWELDSLNFTDIHRMRRVVDLGAAVGERRGVVFLMTEFESHREQVMRFDQQLEGARAWLGGVPVSHGDRIRFGKGFCQLLLEIPVADIPEEGLHVSPCFWDSEDAAAEIEDWVAAATRRKRWLETVVKVAPNSREGLVAATVLSGL